MIDNFGVKLLDKSYRLYQVMSVKGELLVFSSRTASWKIIQPGMILAENVLLQNLAPVSADLKLIQDSTSDQNESNLRLQFIPPTMIRLTKPVGRDFIVTNDIKESDNLNFPFDERALIDLSNIRPISSAWYRSSHMSSFLTPQSKTFKKMLHPRQQKDPVTLKKEYGTISIKYPRDGAIYITDKFPMYIPLQWEVMGPVAPGMKKEVYIWQDDNELGDPVKVAEKPPVMIEISRPGAYFISITTADHRVMSEPVLINFE